MYFFIFLVILEFGEHFFFKIWEPWQMFEKLPTNDMILILTVYKYFEYMRFSVEWLAFGINWFNLCFSKSSESSKTLSPLTRSSGALPHYSSTLLLVHFHTMQNNNFKRSYEYIYYRSMHSVDSKLVIGRIVFQRPF